MQYLTATNAEIGAVSIISITVRTREGGEQWLKYTFGNLTGYIAKDGSIHSTKQELGKLNQIPFTVPTEWYNQIPNAQSGICELEYHANFPGFREFIDYGSFKVSIDVDACMPSFSGVVYDVESSILELTGDRNTLVRYRSTARADIDPIVKNGAIAKSLLIAGKECIDTGYNDIPGIDQNSIPIKVTDSRGLSLSYNGHSASFLDYVPVSLVAKGERTPPEGDTSIGGAKLHLSGNFWLDNFGNINNMLYLRYRVDNGAWKMIEASRAMYSGGSYKIDVDISDLDYQKAYKVEVQASDRATPYGQIISKVNLVPGIPPFDCGLHDAWFNVPLALVFEQIGPSPTYKYLSPMAFADALLLERYRGIRVFLGMDGADMPETYIMGLVITQGNERCAIVAFGQHKLYTNIKLGNRWKGWNTFSPTEPKASEQAITYDEPLE